MNKTLYVRDEDATVWQDAERLGGSISPLITNLLRDYVGSRKVNEEGFRRLEVLARLKQDRAVIRKAFVGRWIVSPEEKLHAVVFHEDFIHGNSIDTDALEAAETLCYAAAETQSGRIAVYIWRPQENSPEPAWANLLVYETIEDFKKAETLSGNPVFPDDILAEVLGRMGQPYTVELDI